MPYVTTWERRAREEGIVLGVKKEKKEIVRKMLRKGIALDIISETTGLSQAEIESLKVEQPVH